MKAHFHLDCTVHYGSKLVFKRIVNDFCIAIGPDLGHCTIVHQPKKCHTRRAALLGIRLVGISAMLGTVAFTRCFTVSSHKAIKQNRQGKEGACSDHGAGW